MVMVSDGESIGSFAPRAWVHATGVLSLQRPRVMAVLNVTPDSFSDGGELLDGQGRPALDRVRARSEELVRLGADIIDIGGESTRPGAQPVGEARERDRVVPVVERIVDLDVPISIDTRHASVARAAVDAGASIVNDVSGLADPDMADVVASTEAGLVIGHLRGEPSSMQRDIRFVELLREVTDELAGAVQRAVRAGVERPRIVVDPGVGFGKSAEQSAALVAAAGWLRQATRCAVLIGASRKSFLQALAGGAEPARARLPGSLAAALIAVERGASIIRVHDVKETVEALAVAASIRAAYERESARAARGEEGVQ